MELKGADLNSVFCTLCEGDYHHGAAALLNSLITCGFSGTYVIGWRGVKPPWLQDLPVDSAGGWNLRGVKIKATELRHEWSLAHLKPSFMRRAIRELVPEADAVFYADPDIVVEAPWTFFEQWVSSGIAICEDCCFANMSTHHYLRRKWCDFIEGKLGVSPDKSVDRDYNSGFAGVHRQNLSFLDDWHHLLTLMDESGVALAGLKPGTRLDPFFGTDQDAMNMAVMLHGSCLSTLGPEGMGFTGGMPVMWHATDVPKPWRKRYVWSLLKDGRRVDHPNRQFWRHSNYPIRSWRPLQLFVRKVDMHTAVWLSRFYHAA